MEKCFFLWQDKVFLSTPRVLKRKTYKQPKNFEIIKKFIHRISFHIPQPLWINLQAGIDVACNVPDGIFQSFIAGGNTAFHLLDGIKYSRVVTVKFFTNVW